MSMDGDMWAARLASKRQYAVLDQHLTIDDIDGDEELRPDFACPYCFEGYDILSLCSHLEDEHFESRVVLCPVCTAKVGKDIVGHIRAQHGNLFKVQRRRRFRRPAITSHSPFSLFGKELNQAHLQALLGTCPPASAGSGIPDLLLSTLVSNIPMTEADDSSKLSLDIADTTSKSAAAVQSEPSPDSSLTAEEREHKLEEATLRSKFAQQLVLSTLWLDD